MSESELFKLPPDTNDFINELQPFIEQLRRLYKLCTLMKGNSKEQIDILTTKTREFWVREDNIRWTPLNIPYRMVILDSADVPLKLEGKIFSTSPRIVLFSDILCYIVGSQITTYPLKLVWISAETTDVLKNRQKEKHRFMINISTPEEILRCYTLNAADKMTWLNSLKAYVSRNLDMDPTAKQPVYRVSSYEFSEKHTKYGQTKYNGIWKDGIINGIGELTGSEQTYKGELYNGHMTGYGHMSKTRSEITTVYEGDFIAGKYDGYGQLESASQNLSQYFMYQGYFKDDKYNGFGVLKTNAYQYSGDFVNNLKEGFGVLEDSSNGVKYIGMFANDEKCGNGILISTNGTYYVGLFSNDGLSNSVAGFTIFPSGIYYKGEQTIEGPSGKGIFYYPEREVELEVIDISTKMNGHTITGTFSRTWDDVKVSKGSIAMNQEFSKVPIFDIEISDERKWAYIFTCFHQSLYGTSDIASIRSMDIKKIWNQVTLYITRTKRKDLLKANNFEHNLDKLDEQSAARINQSGCPLANFSSTPVHFRTSDPTLSPNENDYNQVADDVTPTLDDCASPSHDMESVPDFCITNIDKLDLEKLREYLSEAFKDTFHPLHQLFEKLSKCFYSTYSCWKFTPNSILCEPARNEWISIVSRIYTLVLTILFPALPMDSAVIDDCFRKLCLLIHTEIVSYQTLLYPILMTRDVYSALFVLYASKCSKNDEIYRQRMLICERKTTEQLIQLLEIDKNLIPSVRSSRYQEAIDTLNHFKEKCCPSEMMKQISDAFELVNIACKEQDVISSFSADSLLELMILLIIKANIPQLGAEISLLDDLMQDLYESNPRDKYCIITLDASYQYITSDHFFVNKIHENENI